MRQDSFPISFFTLVKKVLVRDLYAMRPSVRVAINPKAVNPRTDATTTTRKHTQYVFRLYSSSISAICIEKYPVMRLTGRKRIVTLASRIVVRVSLSTACDSLSAMRL
jgi:hypothetical protein